MTHWVQHGGLGGEVHRVLGQRLELLVPRLRVHLRTKTTHPLA